MFTGHVMMTSERSWQKKISVISKEVAVQEDV